MNKTLILNKIINELFGGSKSEFARKLDVKPQTISSWIARNTFDTELIFAKCENISAEWLLTGEGSMLNTTTLEQPSNTIETPLDSTERSKMLDTISTQAHIIERLQLKIESLERLLSQNEA